MSKLSKKDEKTLALLLQALAIVLEKKIDTKKAAQSLVTAQEGNLLGLNLPANSRPVTTPTNPYEKELATINFSKATNPYEKELAIINFSKGGKRKTRKYKHKRRHSKTRKH